MSQQVTFVFTTLGTKGDVLPMLTLAEELHQKNFEVFFLSNSNYQDLVASKGINFYAIAPPELSQNHTIEEIFNHSIFPSFEKSYYFIENILNTNKNIIVINNGFFSGSNLIRERYSFPLIRLVVTPLLLMSGNNLPYPYSAIKNKWIKWAFKRIIFSIGKFVAHRYTFTVKEINNIRIKFNLPKISSLDDIVKPDLTLMTYPEWFAPFDGVAPDNHYATGFLQHKQSDFSKEDLLFSHFTKFGKSLIFTPGTGVTDTAEFFTTAVDICCRSGLPGIFISPSVNNISITLPENILALEYVDFNQVFAYASAIFHHGGIGTTGHALSAGIVQIIVPHRFDQPDNAFRIENLGLGIKIAPKEFNAEKIVTILQKLMNDQKMQRNLQQAAISVNNQDALALAYQLLASKFIPMNRIEGNPN